MRDPSFAFIGVGRSGSTVENVRRASILRRNTRGVVVLVWIADRCMIRESIVGQLLLVGVFSLTLCVFDNF